MQIIDLQDMAIKLQTAPAKADGAAAKQQFMLTMDGGSCVSAAAAPLSAEALVAACPKEGASECLSVSCLSELLAELLSL